MSFCSDCFRDHGLRLAAEALGAPDDRPCVNCRSTVGAKLGASSLGQLAYDFFITGSLHLTDYGGAPVVTFTTGHKTDVCFSPWLESDVRLLERGLGVGFHLAAPRLWMVGEIEPLRKLEDPVARPEVIQRILREYPQLLWESERYFYRLRISPREPGSQTEYDSPPDELVGRGRLDSPGLPILYASADLQVCIHETRVAVQDEVFVATLRPTRALRFLDLTEVLLDTASEFESLDLAVHMLFMAGEHSYDISRSLAAKASEAGFDGMMYPSFFSLLRTGAIAFETMYGFSHRVLPDLTEYERAKIVPNVAVFGRPIRDGLVKLHSVNRLFLRRAEYQIAFGPAEVW